MFSGKEYILEKMENLQFRVGPKSFYQTNSLQAHKLYKVVREYANISDNDVVYDLYTGAGTIANFVAYKAKKVIGIEYVEESIVDAKLNAELNNIKNTFFYAGDMVKILTDDFINEHGKPDIVISDPPRSGMHPKVIKQLLKIKPKRIVYISCNSATQARDIALMSETYSLIKSQPIDMFPQTHHVENVALLEETPKLGVSTSFHL